MKLYGHVKVSKEVSDKEIWYSFYDDTGVMAVRSDRKLEIEYGEMEIRIQRTALGYLYGDILNN